MPKANAGNWISCQLCTYNGINVLPTYHWAYILQQVTSRHLHNNILADLSIAGSSVDQQPWPPPEVGNEGSLMS